MRNAALILFALFIDGLQAGISFGLVVIGTFSGTAAGAGVGALVCEKLGSFSFALCTVAGGAAGTFANGFTAPIAVPVGILLGFVVNFCISATFGTILVMFLASGGMFYPKYLFGGGLLEIIPGFNDLPGWTTLTVLSVLRKKASLGGLVGGAAKNLATTFAPNTLVGAGFRLIKDMQHKTSSLVAQNNGVDSEQQQASRFESRQTLKTNLKNIDGIRPQKITGVALAILLLCTSPSVHAQTLSKSPDPVQYIVAPETPGPGERVVIEVQGIGTFLGDSTITWQQDGKTVSSGNSRTFSFIAGGVGSVTHIHLIITSASQGTITHDFSFYPSVVNMLWEADTTTPLLYKGRALYSAGSSLKVVAFPIVMSGGSLIPTSKLSFQWTHGDTPAPNQSGLGRNTFSFVGDELGGKGGEDAQVEVYFGGNKVGRGEITIPASTPQVVLYPQDPLRGELLDSATSGVGSLNTKEITLKAEPYFFARNNNLNFAWTLNGQETAGPDAARGLLTLRQTGDSAGSAQIEVSVQNNGINTLLQSGAATLQLLFGKQNSLLSSFFGL